MTDHTPTPWNCASRYSSVVGVPIIAQSGKRIGNTAIPGMPSEWDHLKREAEANAAFICRAVNVHGALIGAMRELLDACDDEALNDPEDTDYRAALDRQSLAMKAAEEAIALAKGAT